MATSVYGEDCVANHHVYITDRGGKQRIAELVAIASVQWGRLRDATSEAYITLRGASCSAQAALLAAIEPKRSELVIYRGDKRVWEGPISLVGWHSDWVEIRARDITDYLFGRPLSKSWNHAYPHNTEVTKRLQEILTYELTHSYTYVSDKGDPVVLPAWESLTDVDPVTGALIPRPANVLPYIVVHSSVNEVRTSANTKPFQMSVGEHLDNYARTGGIDYTVVGRALHIWDVSRELGRTRVLTEADFDGEIIVTAYGADHASVAFAVADDGRYGGAGGTPTDWRVLEKSGPYGDQQALPPGGSHPRHPSLVDFGTGNSWHGYRFWMAYRSDSSGRKIRVSASKNGHTWTTPSRAAVDADSGTVGDPPQAITVTLGDYPDLALRDNNELWLFWMDGQNMYRSTSEDGKDWKSKVLIHTAPAGMTLISPSLYWDEANESWLLFAIDTGATPDRLVVSRSTGKLLDGNGQWGPFRTVPINGGAVPTAITVRRSGSKWAALMTIGGVAYLKEGPVGNLVAAGFTGPATPAFPGSSAGNFSSVGRATFRLNPNGSLRVYYEGLGSTWHMFRTTLSGPDPVMGDADPYLAYYGPWTKMFTVYDEDDTNPPTQGDLNSQARRNLTGRSPVPMEVRVPDNSSIRLSHDITMDTLVPGTYMPLLATLNSRQFSQVQKLDKLTVTETPDGETVQVTLVPATKPDSDEPEGEEP